MTPGAPGLPRSVVVREVGPRDGLQSERPVAAAERAALIDRLFAAGLRRIEAVSFVSPRAVPAMADPVSVLEAIHVPAGGSVAALVPNERGAGMALEAGVDELTVTIAASPGYNEANVRMSIDQSLAAIGVICRMAATAGVPVDAVVSCAFGSPYEGDVPADDVGRLVGRLRQLGTAAVTLADTTGMATPRVLDEVLGATGGDVGLHCHETRGTGLLNVYAAMERGVTRFDTSIGGLGGSPFAAGAAGNVGTEDLVALLDDLGVETGVSLERLLDASAIARELVGHELPSRVARVGPRLAPGPLRGGRGT
ncbi:MAG: hydroxymethylglutaryl-CoA lyase [Acidimicrobiales bacterium]